MTDPTADITQQAINEHTAEAARLDAIREGLNVALKAVRFPRSSAPPSA
jgi:hypothetical protein